MIHQLSVPLEKFYTGFTKKLRISRHVVCSKCDGVGGAKDSVSKCSNCNGHGVDIQHVQIAPGLVQRVQRPCETCSGSGEIIKDICKTCRGKKRVSHFHFLIILFLIFRSKLKKPWKFTLRRACVMEKKL